MRGAGQEWPEEALLVAVEVARSLKCRLSLRDGTPAPRLVAVVSLCNQRRFMCHPDRSPDYVGTERRDPTGTL